MARVVGFIAILGFLLTSAFSSFASITSGAKESNTRFEKWNFWRVSVSKEVDPPTYRERLTDAVKTRIQQLTDWGLRALVLGMASLAVSLGLAVFSGWSEQVDVTVVRNEGQGIPSCPNLGATFTASIDTSELEGEGFHLRMSVGENACEEGVAVEEIYIERSAIELIRVESR
ncbi:hypothetical protein [Nesterenkonia populi]|uniref:hypothetical protein n=1 Tax=Nesterenkonia populi TaxID=1591087 RepID=UPI0011BE24B0|nr:hypothetical protein [Nesterenkonia populi]